MIQSSFGELKEILALLNPLNAQTFPVGKLTKRLWEVLQSSEEVHAREKIIQSLPLSFLQVEIKKFSEVRFEPNKQFGELLLKIYFSQIFSNKGISFDLRTKHFSDVAGKFYWNPSRYFFRFEENFRIGLINLYRGYYFSDDTLFQKSLSDLGLIKSSWKMEEKAELERLFRSHFNNADQNQMDFSLAAFLKSFKEIFFFIKKLKHQLNPEFALLGLYLTCLYLSLDQISEPLDVKDAFLRSYEQSQKI